MPSKIFALLVTIGAVMAVGSNSAYASMAEQDPSHPQQPRIHHIYGAFWEIGHGFSSTLIVRNKDRQHSVTATAILFAPDCKEEKRTPLEIMANSVGRLDLGSIVKAEGDSGKWGGLEVQINQPTPPFVMAQVVIENYHKGIIFDLPLHSGNSLDTDNAMHAPWLLSDKDTEGTVTLFNAGGQNITASPVLSADGWEQACETVEFAPHQTKRLNLRELLRDCKPGDAAIGSITIRYTGRPHSLHAALLLSNMRTGFSLAPAFNARHAQQKNQQTSWRFPAVFALPDSSLGFRTQDTLTPYALLSNTTEAPLTPRLEVFFDGPTPDEVKHAVLPITPLGPLETRREDLSKFIQSGLIPKDISHFSLRVTHNGAPGDLGVSVYSVNQTGDFVYDSEGGVGGSQAVDSSYWNIAGDLGSLLTVGNASDTKVQVQATVRYEAPHGPASYSLPPIDLPGNGSRVINLKKAILSGIPDESGAVIPAGTTFGTLSLKVLGANAKSMILGGSTSFDPISGGYGQLYIPDCNDPGPWNGFVVYYMDGIELPPCWDINPNPCDFGSCGGGGGGPPPPVTNEVIPGRLLIGQVADVTINGSWFDSSASPVVDGAGVAVSNVQVVSSTKITARFTLSLSATPGNHRVTVNTSSSAELDGGAAFYVQLPQSVQIIDTGISHRYGIGANGCSFPRAGMEGKITYQILDQDKQPIVNEMPILEDLTNLKVNNQRAGDDKLGVGVTNVDPTLSVTQANGVFIDDGVGACADPPPFGVANETQTLYVPLPSASSVSQTYPVRQNSWSFTGKQGCGSLTNGIDININVPCP